jgi:hypothetical protein
LISPLAPVENNPLAALEEAELIRLSSPKPGVADLSLSSLLEDFERMNFGCNNGGSQRKACGRKAFIASSEKKDNPDQIFIQPRNKKDADKVFLHRPNSGKDRVPTSLPEEGKQDEAKNAESPISMLSPNAEAIQSTEQRNCFPDIDDAKTDLISRIPMHQISNSKRRTRLISLSELRELATKPSFEVGPSDLKPKSKSSFSPIPMALSAVDPQPAAASQITIASFSNPEASTSTPTVDIDDLEGLILGARSTSSREWWKVPVHKTKYPYGTNFANEKVILKC